MRKLLRLPIFVICAGLLLFGSAFSAFAAEVYTETNSDTGYRIVIDDEADLLTDEEEKLLVEDMRPITSYGNAAFITLDENDYSTKAAAKNAHSELFGDESSTLFMIDMDNRMIYLWNDGRIEKTVTSRYSRTITDNTYKYAKKGEYYECASSTFVQVYTLLKGEKIAQPMKHITNALLAVIIAVIADFVLVMIITNRTKKKAYGSTDGSAGDVQVTDLKILLDHVKKEYSPTSGGSSGGGGRGGGGGGHSGGSGGGHSF